MGAPKNKTYKRSWKNLLLNKQYQLSFTLLMVGVSALLMVGLGYWVNREAKRATQIFMNDVKDCRMDPTAAGGPDAPRERAEPVEVDLSEMKMVPPGGAAPDDDGADAPEGDGADAPEGDGADAPEGDGADAPEGDGADAPEGDEGEAAAADAEAPTAAEPPAADDAIAAPAADAPTIAATVDRSQWPIDPVCEKVQAEKRQELLDGQRLILYVLIAVGLMLIFGLTIYGIKMTHKVAGPLHKVSLYLAKMKDGTFDTVYNLRKGDQLADFYEHFKGAHAGVKKMQQDDLDRLSEIIEAAEAHDLADKSPEIAAALDELRAIAKRKEEGLE
jgi:hypothetical protein